MLHLKHLAFEVEPLDLTAKTGTDKFVCLVQHHDVGTREQWKCGLCIIKPGASWRGPTSIHALRWWKYPAVRIRPGLHWYSYLY